MRKLFIDEFSCSPATTNCDDIFSPAFEGKKIINSFVSYTIRGELKSRRVPELSQEFPGSSQAFAALNFDKKTVDRL